MLCIEPIYLIRDHSILLICFKIVQTYVTLLKFICHAITNITYHYAKSDEGKRVNCLEYYQ